MIRGIALLAGIGLLALALSGGCQGDVAPFNGNNNGTNTANNTDPYAACTDPAVCCKDDELVCVGDPDKGVVCSCKNLWDCDYNQTKCSQAIEPPDGSGGWNCTEWNEFTGVTCEKPGSASDVPDGGGRYNCTFSQEMQKVVCKETEASNPSNNPNGASAWNCEPTSTEGPPKLVCERDQVPPDTQPPVGGGEWNCNDTQTNCSKTDGDKGLPPGGSNWNCIEETIGGKKYTVCTGDSDSNPGGSGGWTCKPLPNEFSKWVCYRQKGTDDTPPGGGNWACQSGSEFGGTICEKVDQPPAPPTPYPKPGEVCVPGVKRWCDGLQFCGWGTITCKPDGTYPTKMINGKLMLDCKERADGKRPLGQCGCYHFYFNPKCCERPDCVIPEGTDGQTCAPSAGKVCDYCNPQQPECKEGICAVSNSMETFCTKSCGANQSCPAGMVCMAVKTQGKVVNECIPSDFSCFNGL